MEAGRSSQLRYSLPPIVLALFVGMVLSAEWVLARRYPTILYSDPDHPDEFDVFYHVDARFGRWHRPGISKVWEGERYTINRKGLRDHEVPYARPPGVRRAMMVGDSVVWGYRVGDGNTFSDRLEAALPDTEVINAGVSGYGLGEEYLFLKEEGLKYHPDLVVLVFCVGNDVADTYYPDGGDSYPANIFYLQDGVLGVKRFHLTLPQRLGIALKERSYVVNFLLKNVFVRGRKSWKHRPVSFAKAMNRRALASIQSDEATFGDLGYLRLDPPLDPEYVADRYRLLAPTPANYYKVELAKRVVLEMAALARSSGARFVVALSPFKGQLDPTGPYYRNPLHAELVRFLRAEEIPVVDLLAFFVERGDNPDRIFLDETVHYSVWGHQRVAELLHEAIFKDANSGDTLLH